MVDVEEKMLNQLLSYYKFKNHHLLILLFALIVGYGSINGVRDLNPNEYDDGEYIHRVIPHDKPYLINLLTTSEVNLWHPLTVFSHDCVRKVFGDKTNAHHFVNAFLHLLVTILLAKWLASFGYSTLTCVALSAIWALHPITIESTAWISARKELLLAVFTLLALVLNQNPKHLVFVYIAVIAAFMSKPTAVVLPYILIIDQWLRSSLTLSSLKTSIRNYGGLILLSFLLIWATLHFQGLGQQNIEDGRSIFVRLEQSGWAVIQHVKHILWPQGLHTGYLTPTEISFLYAATLPLLLVGSAILIFSSKVDKSLRTALPFALLFLLPTIGIIRAGNDLVADRYAYLPLISIVLIIPNLFPKNRLHLLPKLLLPLSIVLALLSIEQRKHWRSMESIFTRTLAVSPEHSYAMAQLGTQAVKDNKIEEAYQYLENAILITPKIPLAHHALGNLAESEKNFSQAKYHYEILSESWSNEYWIYTRLAKLCWNLKQYQEALDYLEKAYSVARSQSNKDKIIELREKFNFYKKNQN